MIQVDRSKSQLYYTFMVIGDYFENIMYIINNKTTQYRNYCIVKKGTWLGGFIAEARYYNCMRI